MTVVIQIMDAHLESTIHKPGAESSGHGVRTFGDEIERRTKPKLHLQLSKFLNAVQSTLALDIVREHKGELLSVRPTGPAFRGSFRAR